MKTIKFLAMIAALCSLMGLSSCNKPSSDDPQDQASAFTIEVSNIRAVLAVVDITLDKPAELVRFLAPMPKADFDAAVNASDAEAVKSYISQNGEAIECPFNKALTNLTNGTEYVIGVVAYDVNMNIFSYKTATFTTLVEDDRVVGDESSAGSLKENTL
jgi:hypothetical protein